MAKKGITPERFAIQINTLRGNIPSTGIYSAEDVVKLLKKYSLPYCSNYFASYIDNGIIVRIRKNEYKFPTTPVYIGTIEKVLNEIRRKHNVERKPSIEEPSDEDKIARCIDFLKSRGFLILRQI